MSLTVRWFFLRQTILKRKSMKRPQIYFPHSPTLKATARTKGRSPETLRQLHIHEDKYYQKHLQWLFWLNRRKTGSSGTLEKTAKTHVDVIKSRLYSAMSSYSIHQISQSILNWIERASALFPFTENGLYPWNPFITKWKGNKWPNPTLSLEEPTGIRQYSCKNPEHQYFKSQALFNQSSSTYP